VASLVSLRLLQATQGAAAGGTSWEDEVARVQAIWETLDAMPVAPFLAVAVERLFQKVAGLAPDAASVALEDYKAGRTDI
jgi:hypothetical protein